MDQPDINSTPTWQKIYLRALNKLKYVLLVSATIWFTLWIYSMATPENMEGFAMFVYPVVFVLSLGYVILTYLLNGYLINTFSQVLTTSQPISGIGEEIKKLPMTVVLAALLHIIMFFGVFYFPVWMIYGTVTENTRQQEYELENQKAINEYFDRK